MLFSFKFRWYSCLAVQGCIAAFLSVFYEVSVGAAWKKKLQQEARKKQELKLSAALVETEHCILKCVPRTSTEAWCCQAGAGEGQISPETPSVCWCQQKHRDSFGDWGRICWVKKTGSNWAWEKGSRVRQYNPSEGPRCQNAEQRCAGHSLFG